MTVADSTTVLLSTASVAGAVAAFYYTTLRVDVRASTAKQIPYSDDKRQSLYDELRAKRTLGVLVLIVHVPLTVLFIIGAADAVATFDPNDHVDPTRVAVFVVAGLAVLHAWIIWGDIRSVHNRMRTLR